MLVPKKGEINKLIDVYIRQGLNFYQIRRYLLLFLKIDIDKYSLLRRIRRNNLGK